jgi:tRNA pseudouridine38-40 synthase
MRNIKITIAYEGTNFHGWQSQPGVATIQGAIHDAARKITQEKIVVHGASRTDAGVHALGQVAHFKTRSPLSATELQRALNALLPPAIRIVSAEEVGHDFHSRWQSQGKTYRYRIYRGKVLPPFDYGRVLHYPWPLDENTMSAAAREFEGEHDFTSFAASSGSEEDDRDRDMLRLIYSSEIIREHDRDEIAFVIRGKSFLRYMVRRATARVPGLRFHPRAFTSSRWIIPIRRIRSRLFHPASGQKSPAFRASNRWPFRRSLSPQQPLTLRVWSSRSIPLPASCMRVSPARIQWISPRFLSAPASRKRSGRRGPFVNAARWCSVFATRSSTRARKSPV